MADNLTLDAGSGGADLATDQTGGGSGPHYQRIKLTDGTADGTTTIDAAGGTEANALRVTIANDSTGLVSVDDNGGALTVDWAGTAPPIGAGVEATALRVTVATDSTGVISVDDNGGTLTVDSAAAFTVQEDGAALTALQLIDDIVATDDTSTHATGTTKGAVIMAAATPTDGSVGSNDLGALAMSVDRRLHVDADIVAQSSGDITIADGGNTITVDWAGTTPPIGAGTEAAALRVTVATDSTGVITVDNAGTFVVQEDGAALTALQLIDDPIFADDAAFTASSSKVMMSGAIRDDALSALTPAEGDAVPLRVGSTGALHVTGAGGGTQYNIDDAGGATDTGTLGLAIRDDSLTTLTPVDGDYVGLRVGSTGALHVTGGGGGTEYTEDVATANPIVGTATMVERDDVLSTVTPVEADWISLRGTAEGALWTQDFNSDSILTSVQLIDDPVFADNEAFTASSSKVMMAGAIRDDALSALAPSQGDAVPLRVDGVGALHVTGAVKTNFYKNIDVDESEDAVNVGSGEIFWIHAMNLSSSLRYLKIYNASVATVVVGTTVPDLTFPIPTQGDTNGAGFTLSIPNGIVFDTAITIAATTGIADADSGAPGANEVVVNIGFD